MSDVRKYGDKLQSANVNVKKSKPKTSKAPFKLAGNELRGYDKYNLLFSDNMNLDYSSKPVLRKRRKILTGANVNE
jgi:hypothetical protein